jgi:hypothetical protein
VSTQDSCPCGRRSPPEERHPDLDGVTVLDLVYVIGILAVFTLVGVIAKGVEKL